MAGRIKDSTVEAVRQSADFVAIVEERTPLRKAGARLVGRCPFHDERTPSFSVNAVDKLFYCHGCHKGGDMIAFVRETQGLTFVEAIEWIAGRSGITPEYEESSPEDDQRRSRRERMLSLLDTAASFYERYLWESQAGSFARDYLAGRGLGEEICREFRLGLAIGGTTLTRKALEKGFSLDELRAVGLTRRARRRLLRAPARLPAQRCPRPHSRLPGPPAPRRRPAAGEVREHRRVGAVQEGRRRLRPQPRRGSISRTPTGPASSRETPT